MSRPVLLLSGPPPYTDPWHGLDDTTRRLSGLLSSIGVDHEVSSSLTDAIERLPRTGLLITNVSGRPADPDPLADAWNDALLAFAASGGSVLGLHSSSIAFSQSPAWEAVLGAAWIPGKSGHPQIDRHIVHVHAGHPIVEGIGDFWIYDERYSSLRFADDAVVVVSHVEDGVRHPLVSVRDLPGGGHAIYDALGHASESYDSSEHRWLLEQAVQWLLDN